MELFKIFSQFRVPQRLLRFLLNTLVYGVFALFPHPKKVRTLDENLPRHVSSSTPAAYEAHHAARDDDYATRNLSSLPNEFGTMFSGVPTTTFGASICHFSSLLVSARVLDDFRGISCFVILT